MNRVALVVFLIAFSLPAHAGGGPWLVKKRKAYLQLQGIFPMYPYESMLTGRFINDEQGVNRKTNNTDFSLYFEYGLSDRLNVIATLPAKYASTGDLTNELFFEDLLPAGSLFGLSNTRVALKYGLVQKEKINFSLSAQTSWNTISKDLERGLATGYDANSFGLMAHVGRSSAKHYGFLEVGFHKFTNDFSDVLEVNIEHGFNLSDKWGLAFALNARHSLENGSYRNANLEQTGFQPNNQEWAAVSGKVFYEIKNGFGMNAALPLIPIKFNYVGFNGTLAIGIQKKF